MQQLPRRRSLRLAQIAKKRVANKMEDGSDNVHRSALPSSQDCDVEPDFEVGVGCSVAKLAGDKVDIHKRHSASSPT